MSSAKSSWQYAFLHLLAILSVTTKPLAHVHRSSANLASGDLVSRSDPRFSDSVFISLENNDRIDDLSLPDTTSNAPCSLSPVSGPFKDAQSRLVFSIASGEVDIPPDRSSDISGLALTKDTRLGSLDNAINPPNLSSPALLAVITTLWPCTAGKDQYCCQSKHPTIVPGEFGDCKDMNNKEVIDKSCPEEDQACCTSLNRVSRRGLGCETVSQGHQYAWPAPDVDPKEMLEEAGGAVRAFMDIGQKY